jgi:DNA-binding response OmpR family regulator
MARILVCDDHDMVRRLIAGQLAADGHDVVTAAGAAQASAMLDGEPFELVVLDLHLGEVSGLVVLQRVRAVGDAPVILLSGDFDGASDGWARRLGADAVLPKPFEPDQLSDAVRALLRLPAGS